MKLAYVGARLKAIPLVRKVGNTRASSGYTLDYDWTVQGSARGDAERMRDIAVPMLRAADRSDVAVFLLVNGEASPQAGLHVELGAALYGGAKVYLWTPAEHAYLLDAEHPRSKSFYHHPSVTRSSIDEAELLDDVRMWVKAI